MALFLQTRQSGSNIYKFEFKVYTQLSNSKIQPSFAIPFPNTQSKNQLLFRFAGQQEELSVDFVLVLSDTDLSSGTAPVGYFPNGVKTVMEQQIFLRDYLYSAGFDVGFLLTYESFYDNVGAITGNIENITFDKPASSGDRYLTGRFLFRRGRTIGTGDIPI